VSRPGRGIVDKETCPIVRARGCSAGFIGTGVLSAAPPKFRPAQSGAVLGASALSRAHINMGDHFCEFCVRQSPESNLALVRDRCVFLCCLCGAVD
jgi:hypothetical protein